jgi:hypothetical protein
VIKEFRKRPITITAVQWTGDNLDELMEFTDGDFELDVFGLAEVWDKLHDTWVTVKDGQWVIKGVKGEFYPIDEEALADTYEEIK